MTSSDEDHLLSLLRNVRDEDISTDVRDALLEAALEDEGRSALLSHVNRTGLTTAARLAAVDALEETLEPADAPALARAVVRQHPSVVLRALPLLEASQSAAALFAIRKPFRRDDPEVDVALDQSAARLAPLVAAERLIRRDGVPARDFPPRELAYAAASAAPGTLADIRVNRADPQLTELIGIGIGELLEELAARSRNGSLNDFDTRLRDELHEAVLLTGAPSDSDQQSRSADNLFRRRNLAEVREVGRHLSPQALAGYVARALRRSNRRSEQTHRALLALELIAGAPDEVRSELRPLVLECLEEDESDLAAAAVAALAIDAAQLSSAERQHVIRRFGLLSADDQRRLSPRLAGLGATAEEELDIESFLRWVDGAADAELAARLHALKTRWGSTVVTAEQAAAFVETFARGVHRLPEFEQEQWREELMEGALSWLHRQGTQIVEPSRALLRWPGFAGLLVEDLDLALLLLRGDQARGLLVEILRQTEDVASPISAMAHAGVDEEGVKRVIVPVLGEALRSNLRGAETAFEGAQPAAQRRLVRSALVAAHQAKSRIESLGRTTQDAADAATTQHGAAVIAALAEAERASEGNESIEGHFEAVRRAVESVLTSDEAATVPEDVARWRRDAAARFPAAVDAPQEGLEPLDVRTDAPPADIGRVLAELDQRVHSPRVVTAAERVFLRQDLLRCIDHVVAVRLTTGDGASAFSSRPALGQMVWGRWAELTTDPSGELERTLSAPVDARSRQEKTLKVDALAGHITDESAAEIAEALPPEALSDAWALVIAGLANRLRQLEGLEQEVKTRGVEVMERVAERLDPPLRAIEGLMVGYFRLRARLADAGWKPIAEPLGKELRYDELDPNLHEIDGSPEAERFVVRSMGLRVRGRPVRRAVVEPLEFGGDR